MTNLVMQQSVTVKQLEEEEEVE